MDFNLKTVFIILGVMVASTLIYIFMVVTERSFDLVSIIQSKIEIKIKSTEEFKTVEFENMHSISGANLLPLITDLGSHKLSILVQTKKQKGTVVNYGYQIRGIVDPSKETQDWASPTGVNGPGTYLGEWERDYVFSSRSIFGKASIDSLGSIVIGSSTQSDNSPDLIMVEKVDFTDNIYPAIDAIYTGYNPARVGFNSGGDVFYTPTLALWNISNPNIETARALGEHYLSTGRLYTAQTLMTYYKPNHVSVFSKDYNSEYYINTVSNFHVTMIEGPSGDIVGVYFEEHGVDKRSNILAQAQILSGLISGTLDK